MRFMKFKHRQFRRLTFEGSFLCGQEKPKIGGFEFMRSFEDVKEKTAHCNHVDPHVSCCVSCKTLISYESYVKVDVKHSTESHFETESQSWFIKQLDLKSLKTIAKLKLEMERFTVKELRELYRKSRVAIHANFTNNRHIHEEIMREIEACKVVNRTERRRESLASARLTSLAQYKETLREFHEAHERLIDITQMKLEAQELHTCLMEKLEKTKTVHDEIVKRHSLEFKPREKRERKNSL